METSDEMTALLLGLIHLVSGMPARGEEYTTMITCNMGPIPRSVYLINSRICLLTTYNKTRAQAQRNNVIPRFLDLISSKLFVWIIGVIRPVQK